MSHRVASLDTYEWERTPKLCLSLNSPEIYLKQFTAKLPYCYEFLGNASLSFVVPETERVWLGLLHAIANRDIVCLQGSNTYRV